MIDKELSAIFLSLVRIGIGHDEHVELREIDWQAIQALAERQGLSAVVLDGINRLPEAVRPPKIMLLQWIGEVIQGYEQRYALYRKTVEDLGAWYHAHGFRMMVLKGLACGVNWPKPEHRPYGDIDIWLFGKQKEADALLESVEFRVESLESVESSKIKIDRSHHHHTVFQWEGFTVENHYDFGNVYHHKSSRKLESIFKELAEDGLPLTEYCLQPSANLHALFLLKHSMTDFAAFYVTLRQVLDWGFFVKAHGKDVDWEWLEGVAERFHMLDFYNLLNAICVDDLGFCLVESLECRVESQLKSVEFRELKERVLNDILGPEFTRSSPKKMIPRLMHKYRRWKGNEWKHKMCYNESMWSAFWSGVRLHLIKPASI